MHYLFRSNSFVIGYFMLALVSIVLVNPLSCFQQQAGVRNQSSRVMYIIPPYGLQEESIYDLRNPVRDRDDCLRFIVELKRAFVARGYTVRIGNVNRVFTKASAVVMFNTPSREELRRILAAAPRAFISIITEPPTVLARNYDRGLHKYFTHVFTFDDDWVDNKKYLKHYFPQNTLVPLAKYPSFFQRKKLCTMIASDKRSAHPKELYTERRRTVEFFEKQHPAQFDFYGQGWPKNKYKVYRGPIKDKSMVLSQYRFCFCYENISSIRGYVSEKIFDIFINRCVPIYWGAPNITDYIPAACFIDRRKFKNNDELYKFLVSMNAKTYERYLQAIEAFLKSKAAEPFSIQSFTDRVISCVEKDIAGSQIPVQNSAYNRFPRR